MMFLPYTLAWFILGLLVLKFVHNAKSQTRNN